jgi:sugar phosphate isomerase/epimerase
MKLGLMSNAVAPLGWERALEVCRQLGLDAVELACGAFAKTRLIDAEAVLADAALQQTA